MVFLGPPELQGMRDLVRTGTFSTPCDIYRRIPGSDWDDSDDTFPSTPDETTLAWVRSRPNADLDETLAALVNEEQTRVFMEVGTNIHKGDHVGIAGGMYTVIDTNDQNTYLVLLRVSLRRVE